MINKFTHLFNKLCTVLAVLFVVGVGNAWGASIVQQVISTYATAESWEDGKRYNILTIDGNITATASTGSNNGKYKASEGKWRFFQSDAGTLTISAGSGYRLCAVALTFNIESGGILTYGGNTISSKTPYYMTGTSATFSVGHKSGGSSGIIAITEIRVWYTTINATLNFMQITSASELSDGDEIIFVHPGEANTCSTTQNTDNRSSTAISTSSHRYVYSISDNVQVFYVRKVGDNYGFNTLAGYIYSGADNANKLKTDEVIATTDPSETNAWTLDNVTDYKFEFKNVTNSSYHLAFYSTLTFSQYTGYNIPYVYKREIGLPDHFIDIMHGNEIDDIYGTYSMPSLDNTVEGSYEEAAHYIFIGWVAAGDYSTSDGSITGSIIAPGTEMTGSNTTYYAVWGKDVE